MPIKNVSMDLKIIEKIIYSIFLIYISIYGTAEIFLNDNLVFKSSKEALLIFLSISCWMHLWKIKENAYFKFAVEIYGLLFFLLLINYVFNWSQNNVYTFLYGIKITFLPLLAMPIGIILSIRKIKILSIIFSLWILLISGWIIQKILGLQWLINNGFKYAINVKHFSNGEIRLPSVVGTPDNYAYLLSLLSCYLIYSSIDKRKYLNSAVIFLISFAFLFLSTIRSALLFLLIFVVFSVIITAFRVNKNAALLIFTTILVSISIVLSTIYINPLLSTESLTDRATNWREGTTLLSSTSSVVGNGVGIVGSADTSISLNTLNIKGKAIDNQYLAFYEQIGLIGLFILSIIFFKIINNVNKKPLIRFVAPITLALLFCGIFTNLLEIYPFNVFLWLFIGESLGDVSNE